MNPPTVIFRKVEKKNIYFLKLFLYLSADSKYYLFCWKKKYFKVLSVFLSDTVQSNCPVQIFRKMMKYLKI